MAVIQSAHTQAAQSIRQAYDDYQVEFRRITQRAKARFEECDWHGVHSDAVERLELYKKIIDRIVLDVQAALGERSSDRSLWAQMKSEYSRLIASCADFELAETFFNSVTRRIFHTVGVDPNIEFVNSDFEPRPLFNQPKIYAMYACPDLCGLQDLIAAVLTTTPSATATKT